jgi:hypothetical protein
MYIQKLTCFLVINFCEIEAYVGNNELSYGSLKWNFGIIA